MNSDSYDIFIQPNYFRILHQKDNVKEPIYCLIHGWSGNEHSMSIFLPSLRQFSYSIFPRATFKIADNQYGWIEKEGNSKETFADYKKVASVLFQSLKELLKVSVKETTSNKINLIGFSQGAAISVVLGILFPNYFSKIALIAGYLPNNAPAIEKNKLENLDFYIAHGIRDQIVKFDKAIELQNYLENAGAQTQFCEEDLEHKIGKNCLKNLEAFFEQRQ